jgi:hypothetical protein
MMYAPVWCVVTITITIENLIIMIIIIRIGQELKKPMSSSGVFLNIYIYVYTQQPCVGDHLSRVRACVRACVHACVRACVQVVHDRATRINI